MVRPSPSPSAPIEPNERGYGAVAGAGPSAGLGEEGEEAVIESQPDRLERVELFGLPLVAAPSLDPVIDQILTGTDCPADLLPLVLTPNVDIVVHLDKHRQSPEAELFGRAQYCLPDGQPVVLASRLLRRPLGARLAGSDLFARIWPRLVDDQTPLVILASSPAIVEALSADGPAADFVVPPMFSADDDEAIGRIADEVIEAAAARRPRFILFGVGNPKDARLMGAVLERWEPATMGPRPLSMGLGASFALHLGLQRRAPEWVQRIGMEWFHRFLQEPRRLFRRYFIDDVAFLSIVWRERGAGR